MPADFNYLEYALCQQFSVFPQQTFDRKQYEQRPGLPEAENSLKRFHGHTARGTQQTHRDESVIHAPAFWRSAAFHRWDPNPLLDGGARSRCDLPSLHDESAAK